MAAIREWFAGYGAIFDYVRELGGEQGLADFRRFIGGELHDIVGGKTGREALSMLQAHFDKNTAMDGGEFETSLDDNTLTVRFHRCPDFLYFRDAPYENHQFGDEYCESCVDVHRALAEKAGCALAADTPVETANGRRCRFTFTAEEGAQ